MTRIFGIKQCDTVRKARKWLDKHAISYQFHDVREDGLTTSLLEEWIEKTSLDEIINRKSTSWRSLSEEEKQAAANSNSAIKLVLAHPTLVKRPVLVHNKTITIGFNEKNYQSIFNK